MANWLSVFAHEITKNFLLSKYIVILLLFIFRVRTLFIIYKHILNTSPKIRIKDIAELAGVSEGTVDRVLHNRGEVSAKSKAAVLKVLEEINYSPNILARSLAIKKQFVFSCLIPEHQPGEYWDMVDTGFEKAIEDFSQYNIVIDKHYYSQFDTGTFAAESEKILLEKPDAVIIAPVFKEETLGFVEKLRQEDILYCYIDSVVENSGFLTYYGQNSYQSGYTVAKLLFSTCNEVNDVMIVRTKRKGNVSNQTKTRYDGFLNFVNEYQLQNKIIDVEFSDADANNLQAMQEAFENNADINSIITFNSKVYKIVDYVNRLKKSDIRILGYDLLQQNIDALKNGKLSYLIGQRPEKQSYLTVRDLCRKYIYKQEPEMLHYVPIDILVNENIDNYMQFYEY